MRKTFALLLVIPALASCGMLPGQMPQGAGGEEKQSSAPAKQEPTTEPATEKTTEAPTGQASEPAEAAQLPAIASRKLKHDEADLRIDITQLKRTGKVVTLTWTVTNVSESESWYVGANFGTDTLDYTTAQVSLIDAVNGKRYRVARNGTGEDAKCVCTSKTADHLKAGGALEMYAVYGAPPADVTKVNVEMADMGVFNDVPVS